MKVRFEKNYTHGSKTFKKGDIAKLHWTLADELLKKKVVKKSNEITDEDIALKNLKDNEHDGKN